MSDADDLSRPPEGAHVEVEAKFLIEDAAQADALIDSLRSHETQSVPSVDIVDSYWDTPDWSLFKAGWAYRWRDASGSKTLALKSVDSGPGTLHKRLELEQHVPAFPGDNGHALPGGRVSDQLEGLDLAGLRELFRVNNTRRFFDIRTPDKSLVQVAIDEATISTGCHENGPSPAESAIMELELELVEGREESLLELAKSTQKRFGLLESRRAKFDRGLQAAGLSPPDAPMDGWGNGVSPYLAKLRQVDFSADDPAIHLAFRRFTEEFEAMLTQEPKAWEGLDPEGVHQMRVRTRRLRAAFRAFDDVIPADSVRSFNREFKWVAAALGKVRDLDVYRAGIDQYASGTSAEPSDHDRDYERHLAARWRKARKGLLARLGSRRYGRLKDRFGSFLARGPSNRALKTCGGVTIRDAARQLIGKRYKRVLRDGRAVTPGSSAESLHALRIQCKRLRYLFEFFDPIYNNAFKPEVKKLRKLQDVLGEFQDADVATHQLRTYVRGIRKLDGDRGRFIAAGHLNCGQKRQEAIRWDDLPQAWMAFDRDGARDAVLARLGEPAHPVSSDERAMRVTGSGEFEAHRPDHIPQACVIPFRRVGEEISFCLITSFDKRRWIFPKGFVDGDESLEETGLKEAFEEAGLHGRVVGQPLGQYVYSKWDIVLDVTVLLMEVERADGTWLEGHRLRRWDNGKEALKLLGKPELREMLRRGIRRLTEGTP